VPSLSGRETKKAQQNHNMKTNRMTPTSPCSSPSIMRTRRRTPIRFDLSSTATIDDGPAICLSEEEYQATWWSRPETNQMKRSNVQKPFFSESCVGDVLKSIWQFQRCSPAFTFFKNIRFVYDRSSLDETDAFVADRYQQSRFASPPR
jgi:hypothetical protein